MQRSDDNSTFLTYSNLPNEKDLIYNLLVINIDKKNIFNEFDIEVSKIQYFHFLNQSYKC